MRKTIVIGLSLAMVLIGFCGSVHAYFIGPYPYLSFDDSPFRDIEFSYFHLEDFEDTRLNTPGVSVDHGTPINSSHSSAIDSVDADDGHIDGTGLDGASMYHNTSMTFTFDPAVLGHLPTHVGIVWTDGTPGGYVTFEAFDQDGIFLGSLSAEVGDGSYYGTTAEDRFFGISDVGEISSIRVTDNGTIANIEVDHLQYGTPVPLPASIVLLGSCLIASAAGRFRRKNK